MRLSINQKIRLGFGISLTILFAIILLSVTNLYKFDNFNKQVDETHRVLFELENIFSHLKDGELSERGYMITGDKTYLLPYRESYNFYKRKSDSLKGLLKDNKRLRLQLDTLYGLIDERFLLLESSVTNLEDSLADVNRTYPQLEQGKLIMDKVRRMMDVIKSTELSLLEKRKAELQSAIIWTKWGVLFALLFSIVLVIIAGRQITVETKRRNNAEKQLQWTEKLGMTGRLARSIAHEVRNPLTNVHLAVEEIEDMIEKKDQVAPYIEIIHRNNDRINQLITELLESSKPTELQKAYTNINDVLYEVIDLVKDRLNLLDLGLVTKLDESKKEVLVDKKKLKMAFLNVVLNAVEAMEPGKGILAIMSKYSGEWCEITIADNGKGMDASTVNHLFDPFFTSKEKGMGLGLTTTQNIITTHKGVIDVESNLGQGTTFTIRLPYAKREKKA